MNSGSFRSILGTSILGALVQLKSLWINEKNVTYLILKLSGVVLIGWRLKKRIPYFKVTEIIHRNFENFVIFVIQATVNNYHYDILLYIFQNYRCFIVFIYIIILLLAQQIVTKHKSICAEVFYKKGFLKVTVWCRCFAVNFGKFLRKPW